MHGPETKRSRYGRPLPPTAAASGDIVWLAEDHIAIAINTDWHKATAASGEPGVEPVDVHAGRDTVGMKILAIEAKSVEVRIEIQAADVRAMVKAKAIEILAVEVLAVEVLAIKSPTAVSHRRSSGRE